MASIAHVISLIYLVVDCIARHSEYTALCLVSVSMTLFRHLTFFYCMIYTCMSCGICSGSDKKCEVFCVTSHAAVGNEIIESCQGHNSSEYHTLAYYMNHSSKYFKSCQTYVFDYGNHTPIDNFTLLISGVTHLTLIGESLDTANSSCSRRAVVDCSGRANTFEFKQSSNIVLQGITFTSCVSQHTIYRSDIGLATLVFVDGTNLFLLSLSVIDSEDEALLILDVGGSVIINDTEIANSRIDGKAVYQSGNGITYRNCHSDRKPAYIYIMNSRFINNSNVVQQSRKKAINAGGLSVDLKCPNVRVMMNNVTMSNNIGNVGGNLGISFQIYWNVSVEIIDSRFEGGNSLKGGGMFVTLIEVLPVCEANMKQIKNRLLHIHNTNFSKNTATKYGGGGIFIKHMQSFPKCSIIQLITFENVTFNDNSVNSTNYGGGIALHSVNFMVTNYVFHENPQFQVSLNHCRIYSNHVQSLERGDSGTGTIFVNSNLYFQLSNTAIFNNKATGIVGMNSNIILSNNISIVNNHGTSGGGMLLCQNAAMYLEAYTTVTIEHNSADNTGGGICVETSDYIESQEICFFQFGYQIFVDPLLSKTITVSLNNNEARLAGNNVFGGSIDRCYMIHGPNNTWAYESTNVFHRIFKVPKNKLPLYSSSISSPPRQVCSCQNDKIDCKTSSRHFSLQLQKFPGETFFIDAVLVGQFQGTVPGTVHATLRFNNSSLQQDEYVQNLSSIICNKLRYTVNTNNDYAILEIRVQHVGGITGFEHTFQKYSILVEMKDCPLGFTRTNASCACNWLLTREYVSCDITSQTIKRLPPIWIGIIDKNRGSKIIAFHGNCPFDYCVSTEIDLYSTNNSLSQNEQCAFNRTGILCGLCAEGLSNIFGSSECRSCSNYWLLLFIPLALIGVAFLVVLIVFDITIAKGTLSGIIFYCNIVMSNISIFFPAGQGKRIPFLTSFLELILSLINLEIGIPVCFYNGMDSYIKAWLDFAFPLYLWFLAGVFIFLGGRCSWIVRHNAVKVLATFILLSYTRLLNSIAAALQATHIKLDSGGTDIRWLVDGNIKFFGMKHITLAVFAILLGLLLLPFALSLFLIQWLQKASNHKLFSWVYRLKPLFDVYTGPFTSSGRFWTGLLLLTRVALHIITAVNVAGDPKAVLGATTIAVLLLFLVVGILPARLYQCKYLNVLEYLSLINLGILASLLFIFTDCTIITHVSVCIELLMLTGVAVSHFVKVKKCNHCCVRLKRFVPLKLIPLPGIAENVPPNCYNEDREPLLADEEH